MRDDTLEHLLDVVPDGVFAVDRNGAIVYANRQSAQLSGYPQEELVGMHVDRLVPERLRDQHAVHRTQYARHPSVRPMGTHLDIRFRRKDGSEFPADIALGFARSAGRDLVVASVRKIADRKRQELRLQSMLDVAQAILGQASDDTLLRLVVARARRLGGAVDAAIAVTDPESGGAPVVRAADGPHAARLTGLGVDGGPDGFDGSPAVGDVATVLAPAGVHGPTLLAPLRSGRRAGGVLVLIRAEGSAPFDDLDVQQIEPFAAQAAVALDYARVRDELRRMAVVEDRERIARDLHDGAIQALFAVGMSLQGMTLVSDDPVLRERLDVAVGQIDEVIRDLRNYIFGLRPGLVADRLLDHALQELAERMEQESGVACAVQVDDTVAALLANSAPDVIQLTREALSNVARHARARTCRVELRAEDDTAVLEVDDDGQGFAPARRRRVGMGLRNLRERASSLGGEAEVTSIPGEGTTVTCRIPLGGSPPGRSDPGQWSNRR